MAGESDTLEFLDTVPDKDLPETFVKNLIPVYEHSKEEIIDFLKSKDIALLKNIRDLVFGEMVAKLPQYAERELYARRKRRAHGR